MEGKKGRASQLAGIGRAKILRSVVAWIILTPVFWMETI